MSFQRLIRAVGLSVARYVGRGLAENVSNGWYLVASRGVWRFCRDPSVNLARRRDYPLRNYPFRPYVGRTVGGCARKHGSGEFRCVPHGKMPKR